jgi:hypothetical protein
VRHPLTDADCAEVPTHKLGKVLRKLGDARDDRAMARQQKETIDTNENTAREASINALKTALRGGRRAIQMGMRVNGVVYERFHLVLSGAHRGGRDGGCVVM